MIHAHRRLLRGLALPGLLSAFVALLGCGEAPSTSNEGWEAISLSSPAPEGSGEANLFVASDGLVYLSWLEPVDEEHALRFSVLEGREWSEPRRIAQGQDWFVNWADFPSIFVFPDGRMAAHWLVRSGPGTFDYDVNLAWSLDGGDTWTDPVVPHRDGTQSEHGFVALFPWVTGNGVEAQDGSIALGAAWLDGRDFATGTDDPEMSLRFTTLLPEGLGAELLLDGRVCDCCQTSAALTDRGPVVVYRDRTEEEVRDISIVRAVEEEGELRWTDPAPVHEDGWVIPACPVNGPMVAARGSEVAVAWFTAADDVPRVRVAFSSDGGASFGDPIQIDDGNPVGRVALVLEEDGVARVSWLEAADGGAELRVRRAEAGGSVGPSLQVVETSQARASGFPRMVRVSDGLLFAWTDVDGSGGVETALLREVR